MLDLLFVVHVVSKCMYDYKSIKCVNCIVFTNNFRCKNCVSVLFTVNVTVNLTRATHNYTKLYNVEHTYVFDTCKIAFDITNAKYFL